MTLSPENVDTDLDWDRLRETHEIMYVVKRPTYEFCFAVQESRQIASARDGLFCTCALRINARRLVWFSK